MLTGKCLAINTFMPEVFASRAKACRSGSPPHHPVYQAVHHLKFGLYRPEWCRDLRSPAVVDNSSTKKGGGTLRTGGPAKTALVFAGPDFGERDLAFVRLPS